MSFDLKIIDGDLKIGPDNDLETVENTDKLVQDVVKIVFTPIGSNPFHPWYGSPITKSLIGRPFESDFMSTIATQQLEASLTRIQSLQIEQLRKNQLVTASEQLAAIQNVSIERNITDPRFFTIALTVLTKAFSRVNIPITVRI